MQLSAGDILSCDRYREAFPRDYFKTDILYWMQPMVVAPNTIQIPPNFFTVRRQIILGDSDYPLQDWIATRARARDWWGIQSESSRIRPLPLGICPTWPGTDHHAILGNAEVMIEVMNEPRAIRNVVYMNFSVHTHPSRVDAKKALEGQTWVTEGTSDVTLEGRRNFLRDLRSHYFVACPRGNGVDTHRLWETLYMGSIPIVQRHPVHRDWMDLPICWINEWSEVTAEFLIQQLHEIQGKSWNFEKLRASYWTDQIRTPHPSG